MVVGWCFITLADKNRSACCAGFLKKVLSVIPNTLSDYTTPEINQIQFSVSVAICFAHSHF